MKRLALILFLLVGSPAFAEENVDQLVKQLDSQNFLDREKATSKLQELGKSAIPAVKQAATEGTLETQVRAIGILKNLTESDDKPTGEAAKSALDELAKSEDKALARRAKNALTPKPQPQPAVPARMAPGIRIAGNVIIQNNAQRINVRNVNGVKTIEVTEGQREVKIVEDPQNGITVEITEQKNGKKTTEKFQAKDADDLKKKHPKAYEDYKKYSNQGNAVRIQLGRAAALPIGGRIAPGAIPQKIQGQRLQMAGRLLKTLQNQIERLADDNTIKDSDNASREALKKDLEEMKKQFTELEKKLQDAIDAEAKDKAEAKPEDKKPEDPKTEEK